MTGGETISPGHKGRGFHPVFRGSQLRATKSRDHLDRDVIVIGTPVPHDAFTSLPLMVVKCPGLAGWKRTSSRVEWPSSQLFRFKVCGMIQSRRV
jgi:hypothetical protein